MLSDPLVRLYHSGPSEELRFSLSNYTISKNGALPPVGRRLQQKEGYKPVRSFNKILVIAVGLLSVGLWSTSARANDDLLAGKFTLSHPTEWNNKMLPAGDYRFTLARTQSDVNLLMVQGSNRSVSMLIYSQPTCRACLNGSLNISTRGDNRVVTSMDLAGFHVDFHSQLSAREREEQMAKNRKLSNKPSEQVAIHTDDNN